MTCTHLAKPTQSTIDMENLVTQLRREGLSIRKMKGDGSCLFRSLAYLYFGDDDDGADIYIRHEVNFACAYSSFRNYG